MDHVENKSQLSRAIGLYAFSLKKVEIAHPSVTAFPMVFSLR
jgi:hypothetical protein